MSYYIPSTPIELFRQYYDFKFEDWMVEFFDSAHKNFMTIPLGERTEFYQRFDTQGLHRYWEYILSTDFVFLKNHEKKKRIDLFCKWFSATNGRGFKRNPEIYSDTVPNRVLVASHYSNLVLPFKKCDYDYSLSIFFHSKEFNLSRRHILDAYFRNLTTIIGRSDFSVKLASPSLEWYQVSQLAVDLVSEGGMPVCYVSDPLYQFLIRNCSDDDFVSYEDVANILGVIAAHSGIKPYYNTHLAIGSMSFMCYEGIANVNYANGMTKLGIVMHAGIFPFTVVVKKLMSNTVMDPTQHNFTPDPIPPLAQHSGFLRLNGLVSNLAADNEFEILKDFLRIEHEKQVPVIEFDKHGLQDLERCLRHREYDDAIGLFSKKRVPHAKILLTELSSNEHVNAFIGNNQYDEAFIFCSLHDLVYTNLLLRLKRKYQKVVIWGKPSYPYNYGVLVYVSGLNKGKKAVFLSHADYRQLSAHIIRYICNRFGKCYMDHVHLLKDFRPIYTISEFDKELNFPITFSTTLFFDPQYVTISTFPYAYEILPDDKSFKILIARTSETNMSWALIMYDDNLTEFVDDFGLFSDNPVDTHHDVTVWRLHHRELSDKMKARFPHFNFDNFEGLDYFKYLKLQKNKASSVHYNFQRVFKDEVGGNNVISFDSPSQCFFKVTKPRNGSTSEFISVDGEELRNKFCLDLFDYSLFFPIGNYYWIDEVSIPVSHAKLSFAYDRIFEYREYVNDKHIVKKARIETESPSSQSTTGIPTMIIQNSNMFDQTKLLPDYDNAIFDIQYVDLDPFFDLPIDQQYSLINYYGYGLFSPSNLLDHNGGKSINKRRKRNKRKNNKLRNDSVDSTSLSSISD